MLRKITKFFRRHRSHQQEYWVGIDLGTTKTAVCYRTMDGKIEPLLFSSNGDAQIPSIVALQQPSTATAGSVLTPIVGQVAAAQKFQYLVDQESLIEWSLFPRCKLSLGRGGFRENDYPLLLLDKYPGIEPEHIAACILAEVRKEFRSRKRQMLKRATITIPANWDPEQRRATKLAAFMAGFEDVILLEEPIAAILGSLDWNEFADKTENLVVVDFGGGTCDVSFVTISNGAMELRGNGMKNNLGGELLDELLLEKFLQSVESGIEAYISERDQLLQKYPVRRSQAVKDKIKSLQLEIDMFQQTLAEIKTNPMERAYIRWQLEQFKREINNQLLEMQEHKSSAAKENSTLDQVLAGYLPQLAQTRGYNHPIASHGKMAYIPYSLEYKEFINLLNTPREELNSAQRNSSLTVKDQPVSIIESFRQLLKELRDTYIGAETISRVILVGGSSYLYFVRPIVREVFNLPEENRDQEKEETELDSGRRVGSAYEPQTAVARGAAEYEYKRNQKKTNFKSKLFYDLRLLGDPPLTLLAREQGKGKALTPKGLEVITMPLNMTIENDLPSHKPIIIEYTRRGGYVDDVVRKEIEHSVPIQPNDELEFHFKISIDGIVVIEAKNYQDDTRFKLLERYPVSVEEGLKNKIDNFRDRFPSLIIKSDEENDV